MGYVSCGTFKTTTSTLIKRDMKTAKIILSFLLVILLASCSIKSTEPGQSVNAVIGDISFLEKYGISPTAETNEYLRLQTHLEYVEKLLRKKDISTLTKIQQENREKMLDLLNEYWKSGVFPKNYDYPGKRIPCFIDKKGRICAVGYLIEQSTGREVAEEINSKYKYAYLADIDDHTIDNWIRSSGLTKEECAMIQPAYAPVYPSNYVSPAYAVSSSLLSGLNLSLNTINGIQISRGTNNKTVPIFGLISGAGQIALGALNYPNEQIGLNGNFQNQSQRNFSLINIGLGTSTIILSGWNLIRNRKPQEKTFSWNIYGLPAQRSQIGLGFSLSKRF